MDGKIVRLEYDPNRSARIALVEYSALSKVKGDKKRDFAGGLRCATPDDNSVIVESVCPRLSHFFRDCAAHGPRLGMFTGILSRRKT